MAQPLVVEPVYPISPAQYEPKRRRLSLATRLSLLVALVLAVVGVQLVTLLLMSHSMSATQGARVLAHEVARPVAPELALAVWRDDRAAILAAVRRFEPHQAVLAVRVRDAAGRPILAQGGAPASVRPVDVVVPLVAAGQTVGALSLMIDRGAFAGASNSTLALALAILLVTFLLALPVVVMLAQRATEPLRRLLAFAEAANGRRLSRIEIDSGDEVETLATQFNQMLGRLETYLRRIRKLAFVDAATDLPNHEGFLREVRARLAALPSRSGAGLVVVSLEKLAHLADGLGQEAAEEVLVIAARRLAAAVRTADRMVRPDLCVEAPTLCARLAGQEFGVFSPSLAEPAHAGRIAQLLAGALTQPVEWRGQRVLLNVAAGIALAPRDGLDADALLRHARLALRAARQQGRPIRYFTRALDQEAAARLSLEREMREGIERNQFRAFFQPKIDLTSGRITGAEALARWVRPDQTIIGPGRFIPAAEENGLIGQVAEMILRDACWKAAAWAREGRPIKVAVNVSAIQFADDKFSSKVLAALDQCGLPAELLELEITESVAMTNVDRVLRLIGPLKDRGVTFAIDDFGTGHSSLASLSRLPFDVLKIDQSFVRGLREDRHAPAIVETILAMAASLDFDTVAEGVEREEEAVFLRLRGCNLAQGFLYGAASAPGEFIERVRADRNAWAQRVRRDHAAA